MEKRLKGLEGEKLQVSTALKVLTDNLDKKNLGTNSKNNDHTNMKWNDGNDEWEAVRSNK